MITDVLGYFNTTEGQACHFTLDEQQAWCHSGNDALLTPGVGWYAMGKPLASPGGPVQEASPEQPVAVRCHDFVAKGAEACHLLSGPEVLVAPKGGITLTNVKHRTPIQHNLVARGDHALTDDGTIDDLVDLDGSVHHLKAMYGDPNPRRRRSWTNCYRCPSGYDFVGCESAWCVGAGGAQVSPEVCACPSKALII